MVGGLAVRERERRPGGVGVGVGAGPGDGHLAEALQERNVLWPSAPGEGRRRRRKSDLNTGDVKV